MNKSSMIHLPSVETVRDWLLDSFHQHFDDVIKAGVLLLFVHGDEFAAVALAAAAMLVSLVAVVFAHKMVAAHKTHIEKNAPRSYNEIEFEASFITILREHQEGR